MYMYMYIYNLHVQDHKKCNLYSIANNHINDCTVYMYMYVHLLTSP